MGNVTVNLIFKFSFSILIVDYQHQATLSPNIVEHKTSNYEKLIKSEIFYQVLKEEI